MTSFERSKHDWQVTKCTLKERFKELLSLSQWTDCTFSVGEDDVELIRCHKLVLAVSSPVFEALFFGGLANPGEQVIKVPDMEPYIFKLFLKYIYSDSLEMNNVAEAEGLLYASKKYLMPQLSQVCLDYLADNTFIKTLWDILPVAEVLAEDELINTCLAVMCRYPYDIWWSKGEHMSSRTLRRLLDQRYMNMTEVQLWRMVVGWAEEECLRRGSDEGDLRAVLEDSGALARIRFLAMSTADFKRAVVPDRVLTDEECVAVMNGGPLPLGWVSIHDPRHPACQVIWRSTREVVARNRAWMYGGPITTVVSSDSRVLVTGFEVFTRIAGLEDFPNAVNFVLSQNRNYRERLVLLIKDCEGNVLSKTDHDATVEFNSLHVVRLDPPQWFSAGSRYTVVFELPTGQYPLCSFANVAHSKGASFVFDDCPNTRRHDSVSFINSVLYSL